MARNAGKIKSQSNAPKVDQATLDGSYPARIAQVVFIGTQPQRAFKGDQKPDCEQVRVTYELSHEFMQDGEGVVDEDKPRWFSEQIPFKSAELELATSTKRYKAYVPTVGGANEHEWGSQLLGTPVQVVLKSREGSGKYAGRVFTDIKGVNPMASMPGYVQPDLKGKSLYLDPWDTDATAEELDSLPDWLVDIIKSASDWSSSALAGGSPQPTTQVAADAPTPEPAPVASSPSSDSDNPY